MGPGRDTAWLASAIPTVNTSCDWLRGDGEVFRCTHIAVWIASMRRVGRAVIQSRVYLRYLGLPRASLANLPVWESTCEIYLP
jgi:hypothetical protein